MDGSEIEAYERAVGYLPARFRMAARQLPDHQKARTEEFRLRAGHAATVLLPEGELMLPFYGTEGAVSVQDLTAMLDIACEHSPYAGRESLRRGFLPLCGGLRLGLCGTAVMRDGQCCGLRDISSAALRLARQKLNVAEQTLPCICTDGRIRNTLILSAPGGGKTTLLRDMIRLLSCGSPKRSARRVCVIDERGEIAAVQRGVAQTELGPHTDVLDGIPKALGIAMALRTMNPQIIAVDEITEPEDIRAIAQAANCGAAILATIHAENEEELREKPLYPRLAGTRVFSRLITIERRGEERIYRSGEMP